ncbi:MAG: hypothetical protein D6826_09480, partial [Alphaproteobacteria bacterium]
MPARDEARTAPASPLSAHAAVIAEVPDEEPSLQVPEAVGDADPRPSNTPAGPADAAPSPGNEAPLATAAGATPAYGGGSHGYVEDLGQILSDLVIFDEVAETTAEGGNPFFDDVAPPLPLVADFGIPDFGPAAGGLADVPPVIAPLRFSGGPQSGPKASPPPPTGED